MSARTRKLALMIAIHDAGMAAGPLRGVTRSDWSGDPTIVTVGGRRWRVWIDNGERHARLPDGVSPSYVSRLSAQLRAERGQEGVY